MLEICDYLCDFERAVIRISYHIRILFCIFILYYSHILFYRIILHFIILYCIVLYYIALYNNTFCLLHYTFILFEEGSYFVLNLNLSRKQMDSNEKTNFEGKTNISISKSKFTLITSKD